MTSRGTTNTNDRGSSYDRRARRAYLAELYDLGGGAVQCFWCLRRVREWEVDRWPICGHAGGRYTRDNIVPACRECNAARGVACRNGACQCSKGGAS